MAAPGGKPPGSNAPLHGVTLAMMVTRLVEHHGWDELGRRIPINCFTANPSIPSSLKFLRRTPWARAKVEALYLRTFHPEGDPAGPSPWKRGHRG
ncbi:MAG: VF530 family protein [Pseudomonadota bacterium]|nr:VF530 family protein [Pseudomonadota bacterium]